MEPRAEMMENCRTAESVKILDSLAVQIDGNVPNSKAIDR